MMWSRIAFLLAHLFSLRAAVQGACVNTTSSGLFYRCELTFNSDGSATSTYYNYEVRQAGHPGVPDWVMQTSNSGTLYIYGTPAEHNVGETIFEITVRIGGSVRSTQRLHLTVQPLQGQITQYSEFYVTSHNLEELLIADSYGEMLATLSEVYPMSLFSELQPAILTLIDPRERNFFAPEPPEKLGVVIQVTPGLNVEMELPPATQQEASLVQENCTAAVDLPPLNFHQFARHGFRINWCLYSFQYLGGVVSETPPPSGETTHPPGDIQPPPRESTPSSRRSFLPLIVIEAVVVVVAVICLVLFGCVLFSGRRFSLILPKTRKSRNDIILKDTSTSILEVSTAQVVLRNLSSFPPAPLEEGVVPPEEGMATLEESVATPEEGGAEQHLHSTEDRDEGAERPSPVYHYNERLVAKSSMDTPSI